MRLKTGPKPTKEKHKIILELRKQKKSIIEIGKIIGMTKQGVFYYLQKYGDIDGKKRT